MKIIDCFPYHNEKELLELRIRLLEDVVDLFVICEGNYTQSGIAKNFTCRDTIKELGLPKNKIKVIEVELPDAIADPNHWSRERQQRNAATEYIDKDTVAHISDCDEIINPEQLKYYSYMAPKYPDNIIRIPLVFLTCRADLRVHDETLKPMPWSSSYMCLENHILNHTLSELRESYAMRRNDIIFENIWLTENGLIQEAGWHFSWMGNSDRLKDKCISSMHVKDIVPNAVAPFGSPELLKFLESYVPMDGATDPLGRPNHILRGYPITELPSKIFDLPRVKNFLLP